MKIIVFKQELSAQSPKAVSVGFPFKIEVNRAIQASPSVIMSQQPLDWFAAIWIDGVHATTIKTILKQLRAAFWFYYEEKKEPVQDRFFT